MLIKIKNQIFEVSEIAGGVIPDDDYIIRDLFKATSCIINRYKEILNLNAKDIIALYQESLACAGKHVVIQQYIQRDILMLD